MDFFGGVHIIKDIICWDRCWGHLMLGNYMKLHLAFVQDMSQNDH